MQIVRAFLIFVAVFLLIASAVAWGSDMRWFYAPAIVAAAALWMRHHISPPAKNTIEFRFQTSVVQSGGTDRREPWTEVKIPVHAKLRIEYQDSMGNSTARDVDAREYVPDRGTIEAYCHLRKETRTFRLDRIRSAIDLESGEVLAVTRLRSWLRKHRR